MASRKKMDTKRSVVIIVALLVMIVCGILLMQSFNREARTNHDNEEIRQIFYGTETAEPAAPTDTAGIPESEIDTRVEATPETATEKPEAAETAAPVETEAASAPTEAPTAAATEVPVLTEETGPETAAVTEAPTAVPTETPTAKPTATPTAKPTATPTAKPTAKPTATPTVTPEPTPFIETVKAVEPELVETPAPTPVPTAVPTEEPTPVPAVTEVPEPIIMRLATLPPVMDEFKTLREMYPEIVGWLHMGDNPEDILVDLPVMQKDNDYYLTHNYKGEESNAGALFLDVTNQTWPSDTNTIIYGHNMKDNTMFGGLNRYLRQSYVNSNPVITFKTLYAVQKYAVIAAFNASTNETSSSYFNPREFLFTRQSFTRFVADARNRSSIEAPILTEYGDHLLTLVTCSTDGNTDRFILVLRELRPDENAEEIKALYR